MSDPRKPRVIKDIWDAILDDSWMWIACWGKNRLGKSTLCMKLAFEVYKDWDHVLQCIVWNLANLRYKMKKGEPSKILTRNMLHNRVPILILDDFGATSNKAKTQHELAWDIFKGAFDTFSTKIAVVLGNMLIPTEPTYQIYQKFTHEIWVYGKGKAKYDVVDWQQDYGGWRAKQDKEWIDNFTFEEMPADVYKQYDDMRCSIAEELDQQVDDAMAETMTPNLLKRLQPLDVELMELIEAKGQVRYSYLHDDLADKYRDALIRCKARSLVVPVRKHTKYWYDLTDLGLEILYAWREQQTRRETVKREEIVTISH